MTIIENQKVIQREDIKMSVLTITEKDSFSIAQLTELNRMSDSRQLNFLEPNQTLIPQEIDDNRAKVIGQWANKTVEQLKMITNIDDYENPIEFSSDNIGGGAYTTEEQRLLNLCWQPHQGRKAEIEIPSIIVHISKMIADGLSTVDQESIMWARSPI